jgi:hypothetical protein
MIVASAGMTQIRDVKLHLLCVKSIDLAQENKNSRPAGRLVIGVKCINC